MATIQNGIGVNYGGAAGASAPNVGIGGGAPPNNLGKKWIFFCNMQIFHAKPTVLSYFVQPNKQILPYKSSKIFQEAGASPQSPKLY